MNDNEVTAYMESLSAGAIVNPGREEMQLEAL